MRGSRGTRSNRWESAQPQPERRNGAPRPPLHPLVSAARLVLVVVGLVAILAPLTDQLDLPAYHTTVTVIGFALGAISITMLIIGLKKRTRRLPYIISWLTAPLSVAALLVPRTDVTIDGYDIFTQGLGATTIAAGLLVPFTCRVISAHRQSRAQAATQTNVLPTQPEQP